jgi:hypothetical protein
VLSFHFSVTFLPFTMASTDLGRPVGNSPGSGGAMRGMMPGSEQPVIHSDTRLNTGSQIPNASSAQEWARATSGTTSTSHTSAGARMIELVPSSAVQAGPATQRPSQKNV